MSRHPAFREDTPQKERLIFIDKLTHEELTEVVYKLLDHLKMDLFRTNMTKHGDMQMVIEPREEEL